MTPQVTVKDGNDTLIEGTDYTVSYKDNDKAGTATVTITGAGDYAYSTASKTFAIEKLRYKVTVKPYTHATVTPSAEAKVDYDGSNEYTITANEEFKPTSVLVNGEEKLNALNNNVLMISNPTKDTTIEVKTVAIDYVLTAGANQEFTEGESSDLSFTIDAPLNQLDKVYVNNVYLTGSQYSTESGSTIITLNKDYVGTLDAGTYTLKATYLNGTAVETTFQVVAKEDPGDITAPTDPTDPVDPGNITDPTDNPKTPTTGDTTNIGLWIALLVAAAGTGVVLYRKKKDK